jgi:hypothetical protein
MVGGSIRRTKDKERRMNRTAKALLVVLALAGVTNTAWSAGVTLTLKAGLFFPGDSVFREDYKNVVVFGGELAVPLAGGLHVWAGAEYFGDNGTLPITAEETKLRIVPVFAGLRYHFGRSSIRPYLGAAGAYFLFKEENPIGRISESGIGFLGQGGLLYRLSERIWVDLFANYRACTLKTDDLDPLEADIGGFFTGLGLVFKF